MKHLKRREGETWEDALEREERLADKVYSEHKERESDPPKKPVDDPKHEE